MHGTKSAIRHYIKSHGMGYIRSMDLKSISQELQAGEVYSRRIRMKENKPVLVGGGGPGTHQALGHYLYTNLSTEELALLELAWNGQHMEESTREALAPLALR